MNASDIVEASLSRAESALSTRSVADLKLAQASLVGCLDWAAKQAQGDEHLVRCVLKTVTDELQAALAD